ncbi:hypothetical protein AX774_g1165 [Zancudomyces culisetae]|uniref:Uncharacterized protein n=1 Tax=Zancudomyces culisetae TaxID=1213189 RepID=A0A1R1PWG3_ZANCU|nr:hypothetical protein AX774_g1165 [Zancudomyces culisetae]|eukprot:OMH85287.1 hypothetical protein AX774_g1165 [Zancudomyces culisetae]
MLDSPALGNISTPETKPRQSTNNAFAYVTSLIVGTLPQPRSQQLRNNWKNRWALRQYITNCNDPKYNKHNKIAASFLKTYDEIGLTIPCACAPSPVPSDQPCFVSILNPIFELPIALDCDDDTFASSALDESIPAFLAFSSSTFLLKAASSSEGKYDDT